MCGIAGFLAPTWDAVEARRVVETVTRRLAHRGPDAEGILQDGPVVLGHRRLAIVDLRPEASQPMINEDGRIALVVNGEIYNFLELRRGLEARGHRFRSRSDSEVILHLYEDHDLDFLPRLRGMFALALWDGPRRRLVLARDRYGKKPLYYYYTREYVVFASELQALVASGLPPREPDWIALDAYLALQYVPAPRTAYRGVKKLEPGHVAVFSPNEKPRFSRYYTLSFGPDRRWTLDEAARELRCRLEEAVRVRLVADVPLGAFLSGGVDSTAIVALMSRLSDRPVRTFSIGFPDRADSELPYAREVAARFGTEHSEMVVRPDMVSVVGRLVEHYGEPFADTSAIPTWYLSEFTRRSVTVALSGDAGDENFAGYRRYRYAAIARALAGLPSPLPTLLSRGLSRLPVASWQPLRDFGRRLPSGEVSRYLGLVAHFPHDERLRIYSPRMRRAFARDLVAQRFESLLERATADDPTGRLLELDFATYLPDDILVKVDIASMAHALEVRCPFLDPCVVEFAASLPTCFKMNDWDTKVVLKKALADLIPTRIQRRPKKGFAMPIDRWVRTDLREMVRDLLFSQRFTERGLFDPVAIQHLVAAHDRGESHGLAIWNLLVLEVWFRTFVDCR